MPQKIADLGNQKSAPRGRFQLRSVVSCSATLAARWWPEPSLLPPSVARGGRGLGAPAAAAPPTGCSPRARPCPAVASRPRAPSRPSAAAGTSGADSGSKAWSGSRACVHRWRTLEHSIGMRLARLSDTMIYCSESTRAWSGRMSGSSHSPRRHAHTPDVVHVATHRAQYHAGARWHATRPTVWVGRRRRQDEALAGPPAARG